MEDRKSKFCHAAAKKCCGSENLLVGLAENFKKRHYKYKYSMERKNPDNTTTLSAHIWAELEAGRAPGVTLRVLESRIPPFNHVTGKCQSYAIEKNSI